MKAQATWTGAVGFRLGDKIFCDMSEGEDLPTIEQMRGVVERLQAMLRQQEGLLSGEAEEAEGWFHRTLELVVKRFSSNNSRKNSRDCTTSEAWSTRPSGTSCRHEPSLPVASGSSNVSMLDAVSVTTATTASIVMGERGTSASSSRESGCSTTRSRVSSAL